MKAIIGENRIYLVFNKNIDKNEKLSKNFRQIKFSSKDELTNKIEKLRKSNKKFIWIDFTNEELGEKGDFYENGEELYSSYKKYKEEKYDYLTMYGKIELYEMDRFPVKFFKEEYKELFDFIKKHIEKWEIKIEKGIYLKDGMFNVKLHLISQEIYDTKNNIYYKDILMTKLLELKEIINTDLDLFIRTEIEIY